MSHHDYLIGREITMQSDVTFYGVVQAAMRMADTENLELLKDAWPLVWNELQKRYDASGGYFPHELAELQEQSSVFVGCSCSCPANPKVHFHIVEKTRQTLNEIESNEPAETMGYADMQDRQDYIGVPPQQEQSDG